jgi:starch-binding outer membrane protein, SusD/RagB family
MKTRIMKCVFIASWTILLSFMSCESVINLDTPSESDYSSDNLYKTVSQAKMTTYGIYYTFTNDIYSRTINTHLSCDVDEVQTSGGLSTSARNILARYNTIPDNTEFSKVWDRLYAGVERANVNIERIPKMDLFVNGTDAEKKELNRYLGESLALRAYFMHDLIKMFGDVPYKTTPSVSGENFFVDRMDRDVIYDQIIKDLQTAIDLVPWRKEVTAQARFTKGAVKGMLARIALHAAGYSLRWDLATGGNIGMRTNPDPQKVREYYQIARDQTYDIINDPAQNHRLNPSYLDIWKTLCGQKFDTEWGESMFEIGFWNPTGEQAGNGYIGNKVGVPVNSAVISSFGAGGSEIRIIPTYYASFNSLDVRRDVTVADFEIDALGMRVVRDKVWEYNPGKWRTWWSTYKSTSSYTGIDHILLRYADVLLMFAEADSWLNNGSTPDAIAAVKQVRKRAFKGNEALIDAETYPSDLAGFMDNIMKERSWELGTEGVRKWDLIRWNKLGEVLAATRAAFESYRTNTANAKYVYYLPQANPEIANPKVFGSSSTVPASLAALGYKSRAYTNGLTSAITGYIGIGFEANKDELFPIPATAILTNPALSQHPAY